MTDLSTTVETLPRGPLTDSNGEPSRNWRNWFEGNRRQNGEILSGINLNRQSIVDLGTSFESDLGDLATAYIAADAVVAADAASANATLSTTLTAAFQAADATIQGQVTTNAASIVTEQGVRASADSALASDITTLEGRVTTTEGDITTLDATATAIDGRLVTVESDYATATSVSSLSATVRTEAQRPNLVPPEYQLFGLTEDLTFTITAGAKSSTTIDNPYLLRDAQRFTTDGTQAYIQIRFTEALGQTNMRLPPGRYGFKLALRTDATFVNVYFRLRNASNTIVVQSVQARSGSDPQVLEGVLDLTSSVVSDYYLEVTLDMAAPTSSIHCWIYRVQIEAIPAAASGPGDWSTATALNAAVVTNAAAITTEASARASGDSANAASITTLQASILRAGANLIPNSTGADGLTGWQNIGGSWYTEDAPEVGRYVANFAAGFQYIISPRADVTAGQAYAASLIAGGTGIASGFFSVAFYNVSDVYISEPIVGSIPSGDGYQHRSATGTAPTGSVYARMVFGGTLSSGFLLGSKLKLEQGSAATLWRDDQEQIGQIAKVTNIAEAYATNSGSTARLVWTVNTGTNVATIEQTAAEGYDDGTWNGSAISLTADEINLRADALNLGSDTTFESTHDTFYTIAGSYRYRYGGPFGASSDLLNWYGLNSVNLNSETKTNGVFALATDGKVYLGTAELNSNSPFTASYSASPVNNAGSASSFATGTISINTSGLSGGKTYETEIINSSSLTPKVSVSGKTSVSFTLQAADFAVSESETGTVRTIVTDTTTGRTTTVQAAYSMTRTS